MPLKFPKIFVKYNNNHRTPMDTKTNNDQRAVAEFPLSVGGREVKKKHQKNCRIIMRKKQRGGKSTTQIRRQEWVKAGAGLEIHGDERVR